MTSLKCLLTVDVTADVTVDVMCAMPVVAVVEVGMWIGRWGSQETARRWAIKSDARPFYGQLVSPRACYHKRHHTTAVTVTPDHMINVVQSWHVPCATAADLVTPAAAPTAWPDTSDTELGSATTDPLGLDTKPTDRHWTGNNLIKCRLFTL